MDKFSPKIQGIGDKERESTQAHWGVIVIPKTVYKDRMEQNFDIWDFSLTRDKMGKNRRSGYGVQWVHA